MEKHPIIVVTVVLVIVIISKYPPLHDYRSNCLLACVLSIVCVLLYQHSSILCRYALLGNSLSIAVVAPLLQYLFTEPQGFFKNNIHSPEADIF